MRDERNNRMGADARTGDGTARPHATLILVRATVTLASPNGDRPLTPGEEALVDPTDPFIADNLRTLHLVPLPAYRQTSANDRDGD